MKPRAVITGRTYRYVRVSRGFTAVEKHDGRDRLGVRRWRELRHDEVQDLRAALSDFIEALELRRRRAAARRRRAQ